MAKAKAKVEEVVKKIVASKNTGGSTETLKDVCMKLSDARIKRQAAISKTRKVVQKF